MTQTKFINFLQGFHIIAILENSSKYDISDLKEDNYSVVPLQPKKKKIFSKKTQLQ